ncbi:MAG: NTP transferase domain-containing protein [Alphaproteobacteria bacterium]|nr:NTP transferase domain-containing protein [Alphaproteobacteria bacterium]
MTARTRQHLEWAEDVLDAWFAWRRQGPAALAIVAGTAGGGVRAPGAMMAISADGGVAGYLSGGCIDADVALQAQQAIVDGRVRRVRYGQGSPYLDLPLPCGGAIDVAIIPAPEETELALFQQALLTRRPAALRIDDDGRLRHTAADGPLAGVATFRHAPKLRLRIAGRGADSLALAALAKASGYRVAYQSPDELDVAMAAGLGVEATLLAGNGSTGDPVCRPGAASPDDPWTAFVLAFHDADREADLLSSALDGPAFYVGAVGSQRAQDARKRRLAAIGVDQRKIARVRGPIGLVASMREASMVAASVLAEIIEAYADVRTARFEDTAIILLAAGCASRFEGGDKLMASLRGQPVLAHSAARLSHDLVADRIAVVGPGQSARSDLLEALGWNILVNPDAANGQATSLAAGVRRAEAENGARAALVLLADMPFVSDAHVRRMKARLDGGAGAVMSRGPDAPSPPALFRRDCFHALAAIDGDAGARSVFRSLPGAVTVDLDEVGALDIDTSSDLIRAERYLDA